MCPGLSFPRTGSAGGTLVPEVVKVSKPWFSGSSLEPRRATGLEMGITPSHSKGHRSSRVPTNGRDARIGGSYPIGHRPSRRGSNVTIRQVISVLNATGPHKWGSFHRFPGGFRLTGVPSWS